MKLDDRILCFLSKSINYMNDASTIARSFEAWDKRKRGSMHLTVKMAARRLERAGRIIILGPRTQHDSHRYCLLERGEDDE